MSQALPYKQILVTGAAGFIGSSLVDRLLSLGLRVRGFDNFSTGRERFLEDALRSPAFELVRGDLLDLPALSAAAKGCDYVFHLAANADIRSGLDHPKRDLEQNTLATFSVLEAARVNGLKGIAFSSTGSVYGEPNVFPTPEDAPFPIQTSLYAASKVAGEALIQAYAEGYGLKAHIFRFVSILGERYTHGHVFDFYRMLRTDPTTLKVLGNGKQRKSYLYVQDCIDAMLLAVAHDNAKVTILNLGHESACEVNESIGWICEQLGIQPKLEYSGGERGWVGDSPFILLDVKRAQALGWKPKLDIKQSVLRTLSYLQANPDLLEKS